jgi:hypothetical protein
MLPLTVDLVGLQCSLCVRYLMGIEPVPALQQAGVLYFY